MIEQVWVVPEAVLVNIPGFQYPPSPEFYGFAQNDLDVRKFWGSLRVASFMPRPEAEMDPRYKQVIPYVLIRSQGKYLTYERSGGNEARLDKKLSIGIGGHINSEDNQSDWKRMVFSAALREIDEELCSIEKGCRFPASALVFDRLAVKGILYDDSDEVGRVHVGMVLLADIFPEEVPTIQIISEGKNLVWKTPEELEALGERLERWSRIALRAIEAGAEGCTDTLRDLSEA